MLRGFCVGARASCTVFVKRWKGSMSQEGPLANLIRQKLTNALQPAFIEVINESPMHGAAPHIESHMKVVIISDKFENVSLLQRHRMVNDSLKGDVQDSIHALSIVAKTPAQWEQSGHKIPASPACQGGH